MAFTLVEDDEPSPKFELLEDEPAQPARGAPGIPWFAQQAPEELPFMTASALSPEKALTGLARGMADPAMGLGQMVSMGERGFGRMLPESWQRGIGDINQYLTERNMMPLLDITGAGAAAVAQRERDIEAARAAAGDTGFDVPRVIGNVLSPVNIAAAAATPATVFGRLGLGAGMGLGTPTETTETGAFLKDKAKNVALSTLMGGAAEGVGSVVGRVAPPVANLFKNMFATNLDEYSMGKLAQQMREEGLNPYNVMEQVMQGRRELNKPLMPIDVIDPIQFPKTFDLLRQGVRGAETSAPMTRIHRRDLPEEVSGRLVRDVQRRISPRASESFEARQLGREARQQEWDQGFQQIRSREIDTDRMRELLDKPTAREAIGRAMRAAEDDPTPGASSRLFRERMDIDPNTGEFTWKRAPTVELVQDIKNLGYSRLLKDYYAGKPISADSIDILKQQKAVLSEVDRAVPEYATLRSRYADSASIDEARELGANFQSLLNRGVEGTGGKIRGFSSDEAIDIYRGLSRPEQAAFRQGLAKTLIGNVERKATTGGSRVTGPVGNPRDAYNEKIQQLSSIMGDTGRFKNFIDRLKAEQTMEETAKRVGAAESQKRAFISDPLAEAAIRAAGATMSTSPVAKAFTAAKGMGSYIMGRRPQLLTPIGEFATRASDLTDPLALSLAGQFSTLSAPRSPVFEPLYRSIFPAASAATAAELQRKKGGLARYSGR